MEGDGGSGGGGGGRVDGFWMRRGCRSVGMVRHNEDR